MQPLSASNEQLLAAAAARWKQLALQECYDPVDLNSRPTASQLACLQDIDKVPHRYVTAGNQAGKSQLAARECSWLLQENHPFWTRPKAWSDEPLLIIVIGKVAKQVEEVLWRKIKAFLEPDTYTETRVGGALQKVTYKKNRNSILFLTHHNEREAREKAQAYVAHAVYLDELPSNVKLIEELHRRVQAKKGYFLSTFTPKEPNAAIKALIDNARMPLAKKYQFHMFDNPIYDEEEKAKILQSLETHTEGYRNTILRGDWYAGDSRVYHFDRETVLEAPPAYSPAWRHVESVDPALQSKFGYTLWAENPASGVWYCIKADYIEGVLNPDICVAECQKRSAGLNIVRRISDPHEAWFISTASAKGFTYLSPFNKNNRKGELIKGLQAALTKDIRIAPWCADMQREFEGCQWSENSTDRIVNAKSFHLLDSAQYFVDCRPKSEVQAAPKSWEEELREANQKRKHKEAIIKKMKVRGKRQWMQGKRIF